jgi:hypothetical protein
MIAAHRHDGELIDLNFQNIVLLHLYPTKVQNRDIKVGWSKHDTHQVFAKAK